MDILCSDILSRKVHFCEGAMFENLKRCHLSLSRRKASSSGSWKYVLTRLHRLTMLQTLQGCTPVATSGRKSSVWFRWTQSIYQISDRTKYPFLGQRAYGRRGILVRVGMKQDPGWGEAIGEEILVLRFGRVAWG